jgi:glycosyltransferase involved in cell wall biosynthesis
MSKPKILITNMDVHGVNFYRSEQPAISLSKLYDDEFEIDYIKNIDWNNNDFLKQYDIIHGHRTLCDFSQMPMLVEKLHSFGISVVLDIDDYWEVSKEHPLYFAVKKDGLKEKIIGNLKIVDAVSTTTPVYENYIKPYNKNILIIPNGINRNLKEWTPADDKCTYDKLRILYLAGSSHLQDVSLLKDSFEKLVDDVSISNKFQVHLSGFDLRGTTTNYIVNEEFIKEIQSIGIFNEKLYKKLMANNFDIVNTEEIPRYIVEKYNNSAITEQTRPIKPQETVWTRYEEIFTSNYKLIKDKDYYNFLMKFDLDAVYEKQSEQNYFRHKTQGLYKFAANYKFGDVALAPIKVYGKGVNDDNSDNRYQFAKSNLKVIEAAFHKVPVIASDVPIYNHDKDWVDGKNILYVNPDRQYKDWYKKIKYCINNPNHVKDMGEAAYELACKRYDIDVLSHIRADFYRKLIKEKKENYQLV